MKTLHHHSKSRTSVGREHPKKSLLKDDPLGSALLHNNSYVGDFIDIKAKKVSDNKERTILMGSIGFVLSLVLVILLFEWKISDQASDIALTPVGESFEDLIEIPQTEQITPPQPNIQSVQVIEVADEEIVEDIKVDLDIEMTEDTKIEEIVFEQEEEDIPEETADEIFTIVEDQPAPVGGMQAFYRYIADNLVYPAHARRVGIEGRVFVQFVVEKDGSLTDIQVVKGIGAGCDEEAVCVIAGAPSWNPGKQRGRPVRVRMILPIMFKLVQ
jgi:protein TonB